MRLLKKMILIVSVFSLMGADKREKIQPVSKVGGNYTVVSIDQNNKGYFVTKFKSEVPAEKLQMLVLESDHVHFSLEVGQKVRLTAEVLSEKGNTAEVSQVLLFLPHVQGFTPVWLLSRKAATEDLRSSKYIDMHSPQSDYSIF